MNQNDRVLGRKGARELAPNETEAVTGGENQFTICTIRPFPFGDGDCGP